MHVTCPRPGCCEDISAGSVACPKCWRLIPASIRVDIEACYRSGKAWTGDPLWTTAYEAAREALSRTLIECAHNGGTRRAYQRERA